MMRRKQFTEGDFALGVILRHQFLFNTFFMESDLSKPPTHHQRLMMCDESRQINVCTSRSVAKTVSLIGRLMKRMATHLPDEQYPDQITESLTFTPTEAHLKPLVDRFYAQINNIPPMRSLIVTQNKGDKPLLVTNTHLHMFFRIEGSSGTDTNMVGIHPKFIDGDEMAFGNDVCHRSRVAAAAIFEDCQWWYSGVPNAVRGSPFYRIDQTGEGKPWSRHKFAMPQGNPLFQSKAQQQKITKAFGGKNSWGYITQVLGLWGDEAMSSFPPGSVSWDGDLPYFHTVLIGTQVKEMIAQQSWRLTIRIPSIRVHRAVIGYDYGFSPDPTTFMVIVQLKEGGPWKSYARIQLYTTGPTFQLKVLSWIVEHMLHNRVNMISVDNNPIYLTMLEEQWRGQFESRVKQTVAGGTVWMDTETGEILTELRRTDKEVKLWIKQGRVVHERRKYYLTESWRRMMANAILGEGEPQLFLGYDEDLESEMIDTIEEHTIHGVKYHIPKKGATEGRVNPDQMVDGMRAAVDCILVVEEKPMDDRAGLEWMAAAGFVRPKRGVASTYKPPWDVD